MNVSMVLIGTALGCVLKGGLPQKYEEVLFTAMGLAALGIGMENVVNNMPKSHYPVLFIVSLTLGAVLGTWWRIDDHYNSLIVRCGGKSELGKGIASGILLYCIGALSIVGPVMAAVKGDQTMLYTNTALDFVTAIVFGASFGWGMLVCAPVLFIWQGSIYLVAKFLSASFAERISALIRYRVYAGHGTKTTSPGWQRPVIMVLIAPLAPSVTKTSDCGS